MTLKEVGWEWDSGPTGRGWRGPSWYSHWDQEADGFGSSLMTSTISVKEESR